MGAIRVSNLFTRARTDGQEEGFALANAASLQGVQLRNGLVRNCSVHHRKLGLRRFVHCHPAGVAAVVVDWVGFHWRVPVLLGPRERLVIALPRWLPCRFVRRPRPGGVPRVENFSCARGKIAVLPEQLRNRRVVAGDVSEVLQERNKTSKSGNDR